MYRMLNCGLLDTDISRWKKMAQKSRKSSGVSGKEHSLSDSTLEPRRRGRSHNPRCCALASGEITARNYKMHVKEIWRYR